MSKVGEKKLKIAAKLKGASQDQFEKVHIQSKKILDKFSEGGVIGRFIDDAKLLIDIVNDYYTGKYTEIPKWAITAIIITLLYVLNPFDLIPDWLPIIGKLDDAAIVSGCLLLVERELKDYEEWRDNA